MRAGRVLIFYWQLAIGDFFWGGEFGEWDSVIDGLILGVSGRLGLLPCDIAGGLVKGCVEIES